MLILAIAISFIVFFISYKKWNYLVGAGVSASSLYAAVWGGIYVVHLINPFDYREISDEAIGLSLIPLIAIYIGEVSAYPLNKPSFEFEYYTPNKLFKQLLTASSISVFVLGVLLFVAAYLTFGAFWLPSAGVELKAVRAATGAAAYSGSSFGIIAKYFVVIQGMAKLTFILGLFYNFFSKNKTIWITVLPFLAVLLMGISWGARAQIAEAFVFYFLFFVVSSKKKVKKITLKNVALLGFVVILMVIITNSSRKENNILIEGKFYPRTLIQIFDYSVGTLIAFDDEIENSKTSYGRMSFYGIESFISMTGLNGMTPPESYFRLEETTIPVQNNLTHLRTLNTYSWLLFLYSDFHLFGLFFIPFIISFIYCRQCLFFYFYRDQKMLRGTLVIFLLSIFAYSSFTFLFRNLDFVFSLFALWLLAILGSEVRLYDKPMKTVTGLVRKN